MPRAEELAFGAIIAIADLLDCVRVEDLPEQLRGHPFAEGPWCWVLNGARRIEPVPCKGAQLVWRTDLI
jgi:hypothetical protein